MKRERERKTRQRVGEAGFARKIGFLPSFLRTSLRTKKRKETRSVVSISLACFLLAKKGDLFYACRKTRRVPPSFLLHPRNPHHIKSSPFGFFFTFLPLFYVQASLGVGSKKVPAEQQQPHIPGRSTYVGTSMQ